MCVCVSRCVAICQGVSLIDPFVAAHLAVAIAVALAVVPDFAIVVCVAASVTHIKRSECEIQKTHWSNNKT